MSKNTGVQTKHSVFLPSYLPIFSFVFFFNILPTPTTRRKNKLQITQLTGVTRSRYSTGYDQPRSIATTTCDRYYLLYTMLMEEEAIPN